MKIPVFKNAKIAGEYWSENGIWAETCNAQSPLNAYLYFMPDSDRFYIEIPCLIAESIFYDRSRASRMRIPVHGKIHFRGIFILRVQNGTLPRYSLGAYLAELRSLQRRYIARRNHGGIRSGQRSLHREYRFLEP